MTQLGPLERTDPAVRVSADAVVVIPGIMGSRLVEAATGRVLWGLGRAAQLAARWRHREGLAALAVTPQEWDGRVGRVVPAGLLDTAEFAPVLRGIEPYGRLVRRLREVLVHPDALLEFGYDWRLSVEHNAEQLAAELRAHLAAWRAHPARPPGVEPRVVLVAHSMGGLVATAMCARHPDLAAEVRATVTLGTPFLGAVKAAALLNSGRGTPLEHRNLLALARTLPGVHDLLPAYRCVVTADEDVVELGAAEAAALGADPELFERTRRTRALLDPSVLPNHRAVVGAGQPTEQALRIEAGVVRTYHHGHLRHPDDELVRDAIGRLVPVDHTGDGTVFRYSATPHDGVDEICLGQTHGALAKSSTALDVVCGVVTRLPARSALGGELPEDTVGLRLPDLVTAGEPFTVAVDGVRDAGAASCLVEDAHVDGAPVARPLLARGDRPDVLVASVVLDEPGLYRVAVSGGADPVTELVLVQE
ncbi:lipase/acyltransferase domain-containing protein [Streptomyces rubellomurinus]|nr:hypothetical protein [Streptomyces rubellomurinus]